MPDKTPVEQSETLADRAFAAVREQFPTAETATAYDRDVVDGILETATRLDASPVTDVVADVDCSVLVAERPRRRSLRERLFG